MEKAAPKYEIYIPLTIEKHLKNYNDHNDATEFHKILWNTWVQNKRYLSRLLEMTLQSFPSYSRHDASHAQAVLRNIEQLLGESRIAELSATDAFMLLHVCYLHDIGMTVSEPERREMVRDSEFKELINRLSQDGDTQTRKAADILLQKACQNSGEDDETKFVHHLDIYNSMLCLSQDYFRSRHARRAEGKLRDLTENSDMLNMGFSMFEIPERIFTHIIKCAAAHADWDLNCILNGLMLEDSGVAHDKIHPRFIAVMLLLGDALDMDNGRFHIFAKNFSNISSDTSMTHFAKHQSIQTLDITPNEIRIAAACPNLSALRQLRKECDWIEKALKFATYQWSEIAYDFLSGSLPTLKIEYMKLHDATIPPELVTAKFEISQKKAFGILKGQNIYNSHFAFLREFVQNAVDATKLQCWADFQGKISGNRTQKVDLKSSSILDAETIVTPLKAPIEVSFYFCREESEGEYYYVSRSDLMNDGNKSKPTPQNYGVLVQIRDYGVGITKEDIERIADVGTSYQKRHSLLNSMPKWLRPTGTFGVGLQSAFLVTDHFHCTSYARNRECYRIAFNTNTSGNNSGYINVEPLEAPTENAIPYGTSFEIFLNLNKRKSRTDFVSAWDGRDPYSSDYESKKSLYEAKELVQQMLLDLNDQVGETLFPIVACVDFGDINLGDKESETLLEQIKTASNDFSSILVVGKHVNRMDNTRVNPIADDTLMPLISKESDIWKSLSWIYRMNSSNAEQKEINSQRDHADAAREKLISWKKYVDVAAQEDINKNIICRKNFAFDCNNYKLYVVDTAKNIFAQIGVKKKLFSEKKHQAESNCTHTSKIYYKGIWLQNHTFPADNGLIERVDIKDTLGLKELKLSRNGLTDEGIEYLNTEVYKSIIRCMHEALLELAKSEDPDALKELILDNINKTNPGKIDEKIDCDSVKENDKAWHQKLLLLILFYFFCNVHQSEDPDYNKSIWQSNAPKNLWQEILDDLQEMLDNLGTQSGENVYARLQEQFATFNVGVYEHNNNELQGADGLNLAQILSSERFIESTVAEESPHNDEQSGGETVNKNELSDNNNTHTVPNKFAICSSRDYSGGEWRQILVRVQGDIYTELSKNPDTPDAYQDRKDAIEQYGADLLNAAENIFLAENRVRLQKTTKGEQDLLFWLLSNTPACAVLNSNDGNTRINILSFSPHSSTFFNRNAKRQLLFKMKERHQTHNAERFSTRIWDGFEKLEVSDIPKDVCSVDVGLLSVHDDVQMLFPVQGKYLKDLIEQKVPDSILKATEAFEYLNKFSKFHNGEIKLELMFDAARAYGGEAETLDAWRDFFEVDSLEQRLAITPENFWKKYSDNSMDPNQPEYIEHAKSLFTAYRAFSNNFKQFIKEEKAKTRDEWVDLLIKDKDNANMIIHFANQCPKDITVNTATNEYIEILKQSFDAVFDNNASTLWAGKRTIDNLLIIREGEKTE